MTTATAARDQALAQIDQEQEWLRTVRSIVLRIPKGTKFTTDRVWASLARRMPGFVPAEPRALGAVIRELALDGKISKTNTWVKSERKQSHARPVSQWVRK